MKLLRLPIACLFSALFGVGIMYFLGFGVVLTDQVYRDNINAMKANAFTLYMIQQGKPEVAAEFLIDAVDLDKERLATIPTEELSQASKEQLEMLQSIYKKMAESQQPKSKHP